MLPSGKGTIRHQKFSDRVRAIGIDDPTAERVIDGAVWEIERNPTGCGVYIQAIDMWQARVILPSDRELLLVYSVERGIVKMLTVIDADE